MFPLKCWTHDCCCYSWICTSYWTAYSARYFLPVLGRAELLWLRWAWTPFTTLLKGSWSLVLGFVLGLVEVPATCERTGWSSFQSSPQWCGLDNSGEPSVEVLTACHAAVSFRSLVKTCPGSWLIFVSLVEFGCLPERNWLRLEANSCLSDEPFRTLEKPPAIGHGCCCDRQVIHGYSDWRLSGSRSGHGSCTCHFCWHYEDIS